MIKTLKTIVVKSSFSGSRLVGRAMGAFVLAITLGVAATAQAQTAIFLLSGVGKYTQSSSSQIFGTCKPGMTVTVSTQIGGGTSGNSIKATASCGTTFMISTNAADSGSPNVGHSFFNPVPSGATSGFPQCKTTYKGAPDSAWVAVCVFY
jgi:hypothetical protein